MPELRKRFVESNEWWTFKSNSLLAKYVNSFKEFSLNTYFRPDTLINCILDIATIHYLYEPGNSEILILNQELQECFNVDKIFVPELYNYCQNHVSKAGKEQQITFQNEYINNEFYVESPHDLIYTDHTSLFWIHPTLNFILNHNKKRTYTWKELCLLFAEFLNTPNDNIECIGNNIFSIKPKSNMASLFKFKFFHKQQMIPILKQATKFLGNKTTLFTFCPYLQFDENIDNFVQFVDYIILANNALTPYISQINHI